MPERLNNDGARIVLEAMRLPFDKWMGPVTETVLKCTLKDDLVALQQPGQLSLGDNPNAQAFLAGQFQCAAPPKTEEEKSFGPTRPLTPDARPDPGTSGLLHGPRAHERASAAGLGKVGQDGQAHDVGIRVKEAPVGCGQAGRRAGPPALRGLVLSQRDKTHPVGKVGEFLRR